MFIETFTENAVRTFTLNRPEALNALNSALMAELIEKLQAADREETIRVLVLRGSKKAFAAGADIAEMADRTAVENLSDDFLSTWQTVASLRKPLIAVVEGFALGGGMELAMMADMILASKTAVFGQPEINLGVMPGAGGTQRLTKLVGRTIAMDLCLTGRKISAEEALQFGIVSQVFEEEALEGAVKKLTNAMAEKSLPALMLIKEAINSAENTTLKEGLLFERRAFHSLFATSDQKEGMRAFLEKRKPNFKHK